MEQEDHIAEVNKGVAEATISTFQSRKLLGDYEHSITKSLHTV